MKTRFTNVAYVNNGSIGDFLMSLHFLENIHIWDTRARIFLFVPRNVELFKSLAEGYPYIIVHNVSRKTALIKLPFLLKFFLKRNLVVLPQTFGSLPVPTLFLGFMLTRMPQSILAGFDDGSHRSRMIFTVGEVFDYSRLYVENLCSLLLRLGIPVKKEKPSFILADTKYPKPKEAYVVVHMFAASTLRSLPRDRWLKLIEYILNTSNRYVYLTGASGDQTEIDYILSQISVPDRVKSMAGISGQSIAECIAGADLFVGPDTGITHLSALLKQQTIVIGNLSNPTWLPHYSETATVLFERKNCVCGGQKNTQCYVERDGGRYLRCMIEIPQERIYSEINTLLKKPI